jgi:hypothetical protein
VTLDLGGHTIYGAGYATIVVTAPYTTQPITIRNGRIAFGTQWILAGGDRNVYRFEGLDIFGSLNGIVVADQAEILDCHVHDLAAGGPALGAIDVDAYGGRVVGNTIQNVPGSGLVAGGFRAGEIRRNVVRNYGGSVTAGAGIFHKGSFTPGLSGGAIVADNTASGLPSGTDDMGIRVDSFGTLIAGNVAVRNGGAGFLVEGLSNRLERNIAVQNSGDGIGLGLIPGQRRAHLEGNQVQGNGGCGLNINGAVGLVYRGNTLSDNTGGSLCGGTAVNAGGNYCDLVPCP